MKKDYPKKISFTDFLDSPTITKLWLATILRQRHLTKNPNPWQNRKNIAIHTTNSTHPKATIHQFLNEKASSPIISEG